MLMPSIFGENLIEDFFHDFARPSQAARYSAPVPNVMRTDIKENDAGYELAIDLPGYKKENVKVELQEGYLTISAETKQDDGEKGSDGKYVRRERYCGTCSRSFYVGEDVTQEDIKAKFEDGILKLSVPKKEAPSKVEEKRYIQIEG